MNRLAKRVLVLVLLTACGGGGGMASPQELCREAARAYCNNVFDCPEGEPLRADVGDTKALCVSGQQALCANAPACGQSQPNYHQDKAEQCVSGYQALTCAQFGIQPNLAICDEICTPNP